MITSRASLLAVAALIVGIVIGGLSTARFYQRQRHQFATDSAASAINYTLSELNALRSSRTNDAFQLLEQEFDGQILVLHHMLQSAPFDDHHEGHRSLLESARSYRVAHPEAGAIVFPKQIQKP